MPIHIGKNCWLGAGVIVMPGVTIGDNTGGGAGSAGTKDLPANVVAVGNPCKVIREISEKDYEYYHKGMPIGEEDLAAEKRLLIQRIEEELNDKIKFLTEKGIVNIEEFPLLMHIDEIITQKKEVNIPWEAFTFER